MSYAAVIAAIVIFGAVIAACIIKKKKLMETKYVFMSVLLTALLLFVPFLFGSNYFIVSRSVITLLPVFALSFHEAVSVIADAMSGFFAAGRRKYVSAAASVLFVSLFLFSFVPSYIGAIKESNAQEVQKTSLYSLASGVSAKTLFERRGLGEEDMIGAFYRERYINEIGIDIYTNR